MEKKKQSLRKRRGPITNLATAMMSKKRRNPVSADGVRLRKGSKVFCLWTNNGGRTWQVRRDAVIRTNHRGMAELESFPNSWHYAWPLKDVVGDHRIYASELAAKTEARRRNNMSKMTAIKQRQSRDRDRLIERRKQRKRAEHKLLARLTGRRNQPT